MSDTHAKLSGELGEPPEPLCSWQSLVNTSGGVSETEQSFDKLLEHFFFRAKPRFNEPLNTHKAWFGLRNPCGHTPVIDHW